MIDGIIRTAFVAALAVFSFPQNIIENPAKPRNAGAGRAVSLSDELRIVDTGEKFYIRNVHGLSISPDGSIFVQDEQKQLLQFDPKGRFVRNLMKSGQGPGELTHIMNFLVASNRIFVYGNPPKILSYDLDGNLINEVIHKNLSGFFRMLSLNSECFYFELRGRPELKSGAAWTDIPQQVIAVTKDGKETRALGSFPIRTFVNIFPSGASSEESFNQLIIVPSGDERFVLAHTPEYLIKIFDARTQTVICQFKREYKRVPRPSQSQGGISGSGGPSVESPKYMNDISDLHIVKDKIFAQTSTVDLKKGILFDVFDLDGRYVDSFYLKPSDQKMTPYTALRRFYFSGDYVYFSDLSNDQTIMIRKCRLVGLF